MTASWKKLPLAEFARSGSGGTPNRSESRFYANGTIPWVKSGELRRFRIDDTEEKITPDALAASSAKLVPKGAILIALYGATVGQCSILEIDAATNQAVCFILPDERICKQRFLYYYLISIKQYLLGLRAGGAQPNISQALIKGLEIPLPPLPEQDRLVEILDQADALRQQRRQAVALSQRILPALFHEMFGDPATMSKRYPVGAFEDVLISTRNGLYKHADFYGEGVPILKMFNIFEGSLRMDRVDRVSLSPDEHNAYRLSVGDILFNRVNTPELVGKCAVIDQRADGAVFESKNIRATLNQTKVSPYFACFFYNTEYGHKELTRRLKHAAGMATITGPQVREAPFPNVPLAQQRQFEAHCQTVAKSRDDASSSAATLETLFQTLLHRAFDGSLTAKWRDGHAKELLQEMKRVAR